MTTAAHVIKINCIPDLQFSRLSSAGEPYTRYSGWELIPNPKILDNILRSLAALSRDFRVVPLEVKDDPFVAYHLHSSYGKERTIENMNVLALSPSPLGYEAVRLEIAHLTHVQLASTRLQKRDLRFSRMFSRDPWLDSELWHSTVHLPLMQLLRIQCPEIKVEQVRYTKPGVQSEAMYTSAAPSKEIADLRFSWDFELDSSTDEEASPLLDASLITFWPPDNPHDSVKIVVTETRRPWILDRAKAQLALSATSQLPRFHQIRKSDAYFSFAIPMLAAIRHEWLLYFALDGEKIEGVKYGTLGYTERLDTSLMLLGMVKAVVGFVDEEVLPGYRAEVLHEGKDGGKVGRISELGMTDSLS